MTLQSVFIIDIAEDMEFAPVQPENIPEAVKDTDRWVVWRAELAPGRDKLSKVPYNAQTKVKASVGCPDSWSTFEQAYKAYEDDGYDGVGVVLVPEDDLVGLDLDKVVGIGGILDSMARQIVERLNSYTEISPSGQGLRVFCEADLGEFTGRRKREVELYNAARYLSVTGAHLEGTPLTVKPRLLELREIYRDFLQHPQLIKSSRLQQRLFLPASDQDVLGRLKQSRLSFEIYNGNLSAVESYGNAGSPDQSRADTLLANRLAEITGGDAIQMHHLLWSSPRAQQRQQKWSSGRGNTTYIELLIQDAIAFTRRESENRD